MDVTYTYYGWDIVLIAFCFGIAMGFIIGKKKSKETE